MGKLQFSLDNNQEFIVPRIDDDQIDDLFYQEDEIGEMRHSAFMIECGLEEDPPDGPDVPPVPWGDALKAQHSDSSADSKPFESPPSSPYRQRRALPPRSRSTDDMDLLEEELSPKSKEAQHPRRRLAATKSGSLGKKKPPPRCSSSDNIGKDHLSLAFAKTNKASPKSAKRFVRSKSGTMHSMRAAAEAAQKKLAEDNGNTSSPVRRLVKAKSGTAHGMGAAAAAARRLIAEQENAKSADAAPKSPTRRLVATKSGTLHGARKRETRDSGDKSDSSPRRAPVRKLTVAKSGTLHGMRQSRGDTSSRPPRPTASSSGSGDSLRSPVPEKREVVKVIYKNGKKTTIYKDASPPSSPFKDGDIPPSPLSRSTKRTSSFSGNDSSSGDDFLQGL
ncbi:MAG: hypothetical protein SGARI_001972, partial [Bacillariaceae sp.]